MIECQTSHIDGCEPPYQDYLLIKDMAGLEEEQPKKLYTKRKGLRDIKEVGLRENFVDLIDEKYHDEMCPMPSIEVWIRVKNYYPIGTKIEKEFRNNGVVLFAVVADFDIDTKRYTLKWEEENNDTRKENDWTGRKIGTHLHSEELEKYSVGEYIRKKFNGEWFDGKI